VTRTDPSRLTIVIPARNESRRLATLFGSLKQLERGAAEVDWILVDHLSEDATAEVATAQGARVVRADGPTVASARNVGVQASDTEFLAFLDADCLPPQDWCTIALQLFQEQPKLGAVGARYVPPQSASFLEQVWELDAAQRESSSGYLPTGGMLLRRAAFDAAGGFTESLQTGEDADLSDKIRAAGWEIVSDPRLAVTHAGSPTTLGQLFRQQIWHAQGSRLLYHGRISPIHLFSLTWLPGLLIGLALAWWQHSVWLSLVAIVWGLLPPFAVSLKRGWLKQRGWGRRAYLMLASSAYLAGRTVGRLTSAGRWR